MTFLRLLVVTFIAGAICMLLRRAMDWPYWSYFALCSGLALVTYVASTLLMGSYIERRAPELASNREVASGVQAWETTAGTGVVPKWVSWLGLLAIGFVLAMPFELVARLFR